MKERTNVQVEKETLRRLHVLKPAVGCRTLGELINVALDALELQKYGSSDAVSEVLYYKEEK